MVVFAENSIVIPFRVTSAIYKDVKTCMLLNYQVFTINRLNSLSGNGIIIRSLLCLLLKIKQHGLWWSKHVVYQEFNIATLSKGKYDNAFLVKPYA